MNLVIDELVAFLTELKSASILARILTLAGIPGLLMLVLGAPAWLMTRKVRASVVDYEKLQEKLRTARREAAALQAECDRLQAQTPEAFIARHEREMSQGNVETAMGLSMAYLERGRAALLLAFRTRMDEAIGQAPEDCAPAYETARGWALAALALAPRDLRLRGLADELAAAAMVAAAAPGPVRLKDEAARKARADRNQRLPTDLAALRAAFLAARDGGRYELALALAEHGLTLTRRGPGGEGARGHLLFRRHRAEALRLVGRPAEALEELTRLAPAFESLFGARAVETLYARHLMAACRQDAGDAPGALAELKALAPLHEEVLGARHPLVLTTRHLMAECRQAAGDAPGALAELKALAPLQEEVLGARHPEVLATRILRARCLADLGDLAGAADGLAGVRDGLVAAGLRPEHSYFARLEAVEQALGSAGGRDGGAAA